MAQYALRRGVGVVTLHNPPVNGLSLAVRDGLLRALDRADRDRCESVVLLGGGRTFPAGADISEFVKGTYASPPDLNEVIRYMDSYNRPLVACMHGTALGGGLETALACHWRIGARSCLVGLPEVHLGILPGAGGTQRLPRLTGFRKAVEIITSGRMVGAQEALELSIFDQLFDLPKGGGPGALEDAGVDFALSAAVLQTPLADRVLSQRAVPQEQGASAEDVYEQTLQHITKSSKGFLAPINIGNVVSPFFIDVSFNFILTI
jgi:enoyl-CoA hydratase/carnithine racemase